MPIENRLSLTTILTVARDKWQDQWGETFHDNPDPKKQEETWCWAVKTALAAAECRVVTAPDQPVLEVNVHEVEIGEIKCRRRLLDPDFAAWTDALFSLIRDPETLDDHLAEAVRQFGAYVKRREITASDRRSLTGLALSGGGIRSATFSLGVMQALAHLKLLDYFDYLSTVSGGGYIGAWLEAWLKREGPETVFQALDPEPTGQGAGQARQGPIRFLREYSNYLTPQLGFLSRDTWAMGSIYVRNTMLNLMTVIAFVGAVLLIPRCALWVQLNWGGYWDTGWRYSWSAYVASLIPLCATLANLRGFKCKPPEEGKPDVRRSRWFRDQHWVDWLITIPVLLVAVLACGHMSVNRLVLDDSMTIDEHPTYRFVGAALLAAMVFGWLPWGKAWWTWAGNALSAAFTFTAFLWISYRVHPSLDQWVWIALAISLVLWNMGWMGGFWDCYSHQRRVKANRGWAGIWLLIISTVSGFTASYMVRAIALVFVRWTDDTQQPWHLTVWAVPLVVANFCLVTFLYIGLLGINFPDERREWMSRLAGRLLLASAFWAAIFSCAFYVPRAAALLDDLPNYLKGLPVKQILAAIWSAITWIGVQSARSQKTGRSAAEGTAPASPVSDLFAKLAPYVFMSGVFALVSWGLSALLAVNNDPNIYLRGQSGGFFGIWGLLAACMAAMALLSATVDVNEFSMHHFYRNRLIRAYLGASNPDRNPNGFTGFDPRDDVPLALLAPTQTTPGMPPYRGPYPIVNAALNLTTGKYLAYQERKAESFIFTPRFCGVDSRALIGEEHNSSPKAAYRPTKDYAYPDPGIHVGSVTAISGAFASPNMGFHSSPAVAFLLTVFNVRLGWWIGNPADVEVSPLFRWFTGKFTESWRKSSPPQGLAYMLKDLFGSSDDQSNYVYLTDGGHFDNMGIYELVRRKCRFIVVCDAEEDHSFGFEGLGNAIRKCRSDLGVEIEIDVEQVRPKAGQRLSAWHCVVGKVHYEHQDPAMSHGVLVYLKSSLTGDEPADLLEYGLRNPEFPHQTTLDQFFDESQFESYRRLGYHVGMSAFEEAKKEADGLVADDTPLRKPMKEMGQPNGRPGHP